MVKTEDIKQTTTLIKEEDENENDNSAPASPEIVHGRKPRGWKVMPYILGNETFERLASYGLMANFMVYLMRVYHMEQVTAANVINIWTGISNFAPVPGAFISDAYAGKFWTIAVACFFSFLGMLTLTVTAWLPFLRPPKCYPQKPGSLEGCKKPTMSQLGVLFTGLGLMCIGTGGIRPCNIPFGVDQFDPTTQQGVRGINNYFNWYYITFTVVLLICLTLVVYIQDKISWVIGFGIPTMLMLFAIVIFFLGTRLYVYVKPKGSIFSGLAQVFVAAFKKRKIKLPDDDGIFYDPPLVKESVLLKLSHTNQFRFLDKATIIQKDDLKEDGTRANPWRLVSIHQVEEVKCIFRVIPITISSVVSFTAFVQSGTFNISQALIMDRHLGSNFEIPAGSIGVFQMITLGIWLPFYNTILVPWLRKITKHEDGITILKRMGIGIVFSILAMVVAGIVEKKRRTIALDGKPPMSAMYLIPQLVLIGFYEAFNIIGQLEFCNTQYPEHMRSIANSMFLVTYGVSNYLNSFLITMLHRFTGTKHHPDWLTNDLNEGRLDYYFYLIAGMGAVNMLYYLYIAQRYHYKGLPMEEQESKSYHDIEVNSPTKV